MILDKLKALKDESKLTNQQIADLSGVPLSTVTRVFNGQTDNPNFQTIADIVVSMGGSLDELAGLERKRSHSDVSDKLILLYQEMMRNKDKTIKVLFTCLCVIIGVMLFILIFDILNGHVGYVRY